MTWFAKKKFLKSFYLCVGKVLILNGNYQKTFFEYTFFYVKLFRLADKGHDVIGLEYSVDAILAFFKENNLEYTQTKNGPFNVYKVGCCIIINATIYNYVFVGSRQNHVKLQCTKEISIK